MASARSWWKWATYRPGPPRLSRLFSLGVTLALSGLIGSVSTALLHGFWTTVKPPAGEQNRICRCQLQKRVSNINENDQRLQNLCAHKAYLEQLTSEPGNPLYDYAAQGLVSTEKNISELELLQKALQGDSIRDSLLNQVILLALTILFSCLAGRLMLQHARRAKLLSGDGEDLVDWRQPFWVSVLAGFVLYEIREILTSVVAMNKPWFAWNSFCLSTHAWLMGQIMALGAYIAIAYPACITWCLSRRMYRPKLTLDAPDGAWGVGDYVLFAQTWSLLIFIFLLVPTLLWTKSKLAIPSFPLLYLLPSFGLLVGAGIMAGRFVWQAIQLRLMYQQELQSLGSWSKIQTVSPPPDPTSGFLGAQWWSLPAAILATIATFWVAIDWSGLGEKIKTLVGP